jgi:tellurite resistance protein TerC
VLPVPDGFRGERFVVTERSRRSATQLLLALAAVVAADIAFAVDSIPAAFAITTDSFVIWTANAFALLGLRSLFALVASLTQRLRYLDETIAVVLALVAVKLLVEDVVHIGPVLSLGLVLATFAVGVAASFVVDRRDPAGAAERKAKARLGATGVQPDPATSQ